MNSLITYENGNAILNAKTASEIAVFEGLIKDIKEKEEALKQAILDEMEEKSIIRIDTGDLLISYVAASDREVFDTKQFRADHANLYDEYVKMQPVKSSIRIKVR